MERFVSGLQTGRRMRVYNSSEVDVWLRSSSLRIIFQVLCGKSGNGEGQPSYPKEWQVRALDVPRVMQNRYQQNHTQQEAAPKGSVRQRSQACLSDKEDTTQDILSLTIANGGRAWGNVWRRPCKALVSPPHFSKASLRRGRDENIQQTRCLTHQLTKT